MHRYGDADVQSHTQNPSSLILVEELESMKREKRDMMFLWVYGCKERGKVTFMERRRADTSSPRLRKAIEVSC